MDKMALSKRLLLIGAVITMVCAIGMLYGDQHFPVMSNNSLRVAYGVLFLGCGIGVISIAVGCYLMSIRLHPGHVLITGIVLVTGALLGPTALNILSFKAGHSTGLFVLVGFEGLAVCGFIVALVGLVRCMSQYWHRS